MAGSNLIARYSDEPGGRRNKTRLVQYITIGPVTFQDGKEGASMVRVERGVFHGSLGRIGT